MRREESRSEEPESGGTAGAPGPGFARSAPRGVPGFCARAPRRLLAAAALPFLGAFAADARGDEPTPPPLGNVVYRGEIRTDDRGADTDEFGGRLIAGESLDLVVTSAYQSPLYPLVEVVGPDGVVRPVRIRANGSGRRLTGRRIPIDTTGFWRVRVVPFAGTRGKYSARFRIRRAPSVSIDVLPAETAADVPLPFAGIEGASLELRWAWKGAQGPTLASLRDPGGADVPDPDDPGGAAHATDRAVARERTASLSVEPLAAGDGTYVARFTAPAGHRGFRAWAAVRVPGRVRGVRTLSVEEPWIAPRASPLRLAAEVRVRIAGEGLSSSTRVFFGGVEGVEPSSDPFGTYVDVDAPPGTDGAVVGVSVLNPDGQGYSRDAYFYYVPEPKVTAVVSRLGVPVRGGSTAGGLPIRLEGSNFQSGVIVRIGSSAAIVPQILSDTLLEVKTPAQAAGIVSVRIEDSYLHEVAAPEPFEYKVPPTLAALPYSPPAVDGSADAVLAISGSGFGLDDVVILGGAEVATQYFTPAQLRITVPAGPSETLTLSVRDRVGTVVTGPPLVRSTPP